MIFLFAFIASVAFFIQAALGFGGGLVSIPVLSLFMPVHEAVSYIMAFQFLIGLTLFKVYRDVDWSVIRFLLPGTVAGALVGMGLLAYLPQNAVQLFLAIFILLYLAQERLGVQWLKNLVARLGSFVSGFLGGMIAGLIGMGAPIYVLYFKARGMRTASLRANLVLILFLANVVRFPVALSTSLMPVHIVMLVIYTLPFFMFAMWLGVKTHDRLPDVLFRRTVDGALLLSSVSLIAKALF
ncbi:MAG: sulfite exporter TauE/SafE family protein [Alphaproteobacteria bacterium]|nr:sulfite exporter TauE/SafE family protein [Alphaproteobacteria bacterium]